METIRIGTRGSALAMAQANLTRDLIVRKFPSVAVEIEVIKTQGDKDRVRSLVSFGGQGVFVKEIEEALLEKRIDLAVHSLKDVPDSMDSLLELSGFLKREDFRDVLVSGGVRFSDLKPGAKIGTGSPRRVLQLKSGECDAILLGAAGLVRLEMSSLITERFSIEKITPAIGQGIIALQSCVENKRAKEIAEGISDEATVIAARTERRWMNLLGGGCRVPMGAVLESEPDSFCFTAYLADPRDGRFLRRSQRFTALKLKSGEKLEKFADEFMGECRRQGILLPLETNGPEAISTFWESER